MIKLYLNIMNLLKDLKKVKNWKSFYSRRVWNETDQGKLAIFFNLLDHFNLFRMPIFYFDYEKYQNWNIQKKNDTFRNFYHFY